MLARFSTGAATAEARRPARQVRMKSMLVSVSVVNVSAIGVG